MPTSYSQDDLVGDFYGNLQAAPTQSARIRTPNTDIQNTENVLRSLNLYDELHDVANICATTEGGLIFRFCYGLSEYSLPIASREEFEAMDNWVIVERADGELNAVPKELTVECQNCERRYFIADGRKIDGETTWCPECLADRQECCCCGYYREDLSYAEYDNGDTYGDICEECQNSNMFRWDEDRECYVKRSDRSMSVNMYLNPKGVLAHGTRCSECNETEGGWCPRHLKEKIKEINAEQTTLWIYDDERRNYHESAHNRFKTLKYRLPHERPFLYYGIELEYLFNCPLNKREQIVKEYIKATGGLFAAEYDRSVDDLGCGSEFISRPLSYKAWTSDKVKQLMKKGEEVLKKYNVYDPQPDGCGLHVHMSKRFFEENTKKRVRDIKNDIDWLFQYYQPEFEKISKRKYTRYCTSKAMRAQDKLKGMNMGNIKGSLQIEKGGLMMSTGSGETHHECINESRATIEARTFISMVHYEDIMAIIEFCRSIAHSARNEASLSGVSLGDILYAKDGKYLPKYLAKIKDLDLDKKFKNKLEVKF